MALRPHDPVAARLVDRQLTNALRRYLFTLGVPGGEIDEILDEARFQVFDQGLPATPGEVNRLLFCIAYRRAMDWHREAKVALLGNKSVCIALGTHRVDEPPSAPVEAERALEDLAELAAGNPRHACAFAAIRQKMAGKSLERYAEEAGVPAGTLRQWVNRFRAHAREQMPWLVAFY
jgi:DNA-directed RNA polymerase specialized sigma24 family protein